MRPAPGMGCTGQVRPLLPVQQAEVGHPPVQPGLQGLRNKGGRRLAEAQGRGQCGLPWEEAQEGDRE